MKCFLNLENYGKYGKFVETHTCMSPPIFYILCELGWGGVSGEFYEHLWICVNRNRNIVFKKKLKHSGRFKKIERTHIGVIVFSYCVIMLIFGNFWYEFSEFE